MTAKGSFKGIAIELLQITSLMVLVALFVLTSCKKKTDENVKVTTKPITEITVNSAKCGGTVAASGNNTIGTCGICWSEMSGPTVDDLFTTDNQGTGEFTSLMKNLKPGTKYYVRAYATTGSGILYGEELNFMTEALPTLDVTVYTNDVVEITTLTARCGGVVTSNGDATVTQRGVCWSTSSNPTIGCSHTEDGQGMGSFSSTLSSLSASTCYYVRAYAITEDGDAVYGDEKQFISASDGSSNDTVIVYTNEVSDITLTSAKCGGVVSVTGNFSIIAKGVCWALSPNPTVSGAHTADGQGTGAFASDVTDLLAGTNYYIRAYASISSGNTVYGDSKTFMTEAGNVDPSLPTVTIGEATDVTANSAKISGNVVSEGSAMVTERGLCWSTFSNPMIFHSHINCGTGPGEFEGQLTGLEVGTTYHVRAYATNSEGTKYSDEEKVFITDDVPTVTTNPITHITQTGANCSGTVVDDGGSSVTKRGFCWGTTPNPTVDDGVSLVGGGGTGDFSKNLEMVLTPNTHYYLRAFAKNSIGIGYGENQQFTTLSVADDKYLYYGDGNYDTSWGLTNGGDHEWAVMFPASMLVPYDGMWIAKVQCYIHETGDYKLKIYQGNGTLSPTLVKSLNFSITQTGWLNLLLGEYAVQLNTQKDLWVSLSYSSEAGQYPMSCGIGANEPNARWRKYDDGWHDFSDNNENKDLCWLIQVFVTGNTKDGTEVESELPASVNPVTHMDRPNYNKSSVRDRRFSYSSKK